MQYHKPEQNGAELNGIDIDNKRYRKLTSFIFIEIPLQSPFDKIIEIGHFHPVLIQILAPFLRNGGKITPAIFFLFVKRDRLFQPILIGWTHLLRFGASRDW